jgi:CheY-like chemotaxis protein
MNGNIKSVTSEWGFKPVIPEIIKDSRVLIVEDDEAVGDVLRDFLESAKVKVTMAANGADALRQIISNHFDAILCDMVMPTMPGDMFYLAVERTKPKLCHRFVFMTGYKADPKVSSFLERQENPVLYKPFQMMELLDALEVTMKRKDA